MHGIISRDLYIMLQRLTYHWKVNKTKNKILKLCSTGLTITNITQTNEQQY